MILVGTTGPSFKLTIGFAVGDVTVFVFYKVLFASAKTVFWLKLDGTGVD